jgi:hypothetical protein
VAVAALVSVLLAKDMPDCGRDIVYGVAVLGIALL